jgi:hypothetical protein
MLWYLEGGWGWLYVHYLTFTLEQSLVSCGSNELITPVLGENVPGNLAYDPIKRIKYDLALIVIYGTLSTESHFQFDEKIQYGNFRMKPTWQVSRTSLTQNLLSLEWKQFSIIEKMNIFRNALKKDYWEIHVFCLILFWTWWSGRTMVAYLIPYGRIPRL